MAYALINSVAAGSSGGGTFTSGSISTSGSTLLVAMVSSYHPATEPTLSDSSSNTWTALGTSTGNDIRLKLFYVNSATPTTSGTHTVTVTGAGAFASVVFAGFSGSAATPGDQFGSRNTGSSTTADCAAAAITPSENGCLLIGGIGFISATTGLTIDNSLTVQHFLQYSDTNYLGIGFAWKEQATAAAINPAFSWTTNALTASLIGSFKPGAGGGGGRIWKLAGYGGGLVGSPAGLAG